jgi:uncharacterized protein (TIGR03790 family)
VAEQQGLVGKCYFDARGLPYGPPNDGGWGYNGVDQGIRDAAKLLQGAGLPTVLDNAAALFAPGACPNCALYCGWYSQAHYIDSFTFVPGAVAYHIASSEMVTLHRPNVPYWCPNLLAKGAVATVGPVAEPLTLSFPKPAEFYGFLLTGRYTLVESYWLAQPNASWMMVLVGDPLYNPFAKAPKLRVDQVVPSPQGSAPPPQAGQGP